MSTIHTTVFTCDFCGLKQTKEFGLIPMGWREINSEHGSHEHRICGHGYQRVTRHACGNCWRVVENAFRPPKPRAGETEL